MPKERTVDIEHPADQVFDALLAAIPSIAGVKVKDQDRGSGRIVAATRMNWRTWGDNIALVVASRGPDQAQVTVSSSMKIGLVDWGKGNSNIEQILAALDAELRRRGARPTSPPADPSPPMPPPPHVGEPSS